MTGYEVYILNIFEITCLVSRQNRINGEEFNYFVSYRFKIQYY